MNSERTTSTADIPRGSTPLPAAVLVAYKALLDVCSANKVPLRTLLETPEASRLHAAAVKIEEQASIIKRQREIIAHLEQQLDIDNEL
jgi:hypothetical protein